MSDLNKQKFGASLVRCIATRQPNENTNPETSRIEVLENKIKLLNNKFDECFNLLKTLDHKLDILLCNDVKKIHFPITNKRELKKVDDEIGENFDSFLPIIKNILLPRGLKKNLSKIISEELTMGYNYEGIKGNSAFKSFKNLNKAMYEVTMREGYDEKEYARDIKKAFHLIKVRQFKKRHFAKKRGH